jgi:hypothetical protein
MTNPTQSGSAICKDCGAKRLLGSEFRLLQQLPDSTLTQFPAHFQLRDSLRTITELSRTVTPPAWRHVRPAETYVMHQAQKTGAAWDRCLSDYAYTRHIPLKGWAWEFLRHNADYQRDVRLNRAGHPTAVQHKSGATLFRLRRKLPSAEHWGLSFFSDPNKTAVEVMPFWLPELLTPIAFCEANIANDNLEEQLSLACFAGRRVVLATGKHEVISVCNGQRAANLVVTDGSLLVGNRALKFHHQGLKTATRHFETLKLLTQFRENLDNFGSFVSTSDSKYRDYLVALDGRLAGRSYRDIAELLYGSERVEAFWTDDTRGLKSKVRRAVECGLALMNGGYRDLL